MFLEIAAGFAGPAEWSKRTCLSGRCGETSVVSQKSYSPKGVKPLSLGHGHSYTKDAAAAG